ncbi:NACHT domain-containing protein [Streptomyces sp. NPDC044571]|uniref:NACHT domain-containing protein n=1 Tax=Streptomyces sp. NPDC044571 TaxID=3155371 RepID=UPI00340EDABF
MTGFETVLLRVASTAASTLARSLLARAPGAGLAADPAAVAPRWRRPADLGAPEIRRLSETLAARLGKATAGLPEHERLAAVDAVGDAFAGLGTLKADALLAADLDPAALMALLPEPAGAALSDPARALYRDLVRLCCTHVVEYLTTLPGFGARADVELVRRTGELARAVDRLGRAGDGAAYAFEERYARYVAETHGRLQLFGLTTGRARQEWPLDLAYISLGVSGEQQPVPGEPGVHQTTVKAETALGATDRVLLRGPAGSGKSTLVQWLAVNAARQAGGPWGTRVPFVLRLRAFTSAQSLPLPEEFLRASGVPLAAPPGWTEELMASGRALILVDGVDEVPQRLRARTETWLRSLVTAFPKARYVVTTRPSAVSEDWLAGLGFTPHSLLPMEREDIRSFIGHWHAAARAEADPCGQELDAYETSLLEAVGARRDLGRLATNPLMCALLCALNRDRRMQLPRARKELYDAALDMLLVRRDTEREISGVEGVYLTREEQIALLQRFAYWLIRNGQVEAGRDEAVEMVGEWLDSMPQVREQGDAEQVFSHLLIRSGLLREPVKGSVDFVHRTFQDYLGAKAAVESRDFGVLVKNAQDDTWDDVVRMAVGHARPDERTRILRGLLKRADKVKTARSRLVLLAAACLEHAAELDPAVRAEIQSRTAELLPPTRLSQAEELAKAGELVLDLLPGSDDLSEAEAAAVVRTAALVGGPQALAVLTRFRADTRPMVRAQLAGGWQHFDRIAYADTVLTEVDLSHTYLTVESAEELSLLDRLPAVRNLTLRGGLGIPDAVTLMHGRLEGLALQQDELLTDLSPLARFERLSYLGLYECPRVEDLGPLSGLPLQTVTLTRVRPGLSLSPLASLDHLTHLTLDFAMDVRNVGELAVPDSLRSFGLWENASLLDLHGLERWPDLRVLTLSGERQTAQLAAQQSAPALNILQLHTMAVDPSQLVRHEQLTELLLYKCSLASGLEPLLALPRLTRLAVSFSTGPVDLSPLAAREDLFIDVFGPNALLGTELFPPGRLVYKN